MKVDHDWLPEENEDEDERLARVGCPDEENEETEGTP